MAMGMEMATWKFDANKKQIVLKSKRNKNFNGAMKIVFLSAEQMVLKKGADTYTYSRVEPDKIKQNNEKSGLAGLWSLSGTEYPCAFLKLDLPQDFALVRVAFGETDRASGSWIFSPKDQTIIFVGFSELLRGKVKLADLKKNSFSLQLADRTLQAKKVKPAPIERLTFKEDDFPEEPDEQSQARLPWKNFDGMVQFLSKVKAVRYSVGQLLPKLNVLAYPTKHLAKVQADVQKPSVRFTNLSVSEGNTSQYSEKVLNEMSSDEFHFFPLEDFWQYRVVGNEKLTVPAGTFDCTVVEAVDGDKKFKLWMINDKPGIYAKIIREETDPFGKVNYSAEELEQVDYLK
ncbi:MAG TPA: hypothetical protein ENJ89_02770 [Caldithrix abyssi]|uniref:Uncharacterized protein n=1 Tax=Caldithrix abyssi TaxID=187145 RepID=A0A7V5UEC8_CALAY|nr:hypothetical protein [Caldithrix abyssi]